MGLKEVPDLAGLCGNPDWVRVGQIVEMQSSDSGYKGAWFVVRIIRLRKKDGYNQAYLEHLNFHKDDKAGSAFLKEWAKVIDLRPLPPPRSRQPWKVRDCVETLWEHAWWVGYIKEVQSSGKYLVWYNDHDEPQIIAFGDIRVALKFEHTTMDNPKAPCWSNQRRMQNPPSWEMPKKDMWDEMDEMRGLRFVSCPGRIVEESEDDEWRPMPKKSRVQPTKRIEGSTDKEKSQVPPTKKVRILLSKTVTQALPAVNSLAKPSEQTAVCITPGSSPPQSGSPDQDSAILLGTELLAYPAARTSDTVSESSSSGEDGDDDDVGPRSDDGDGGEDLMSKQIFHDEAFENQSKKCMDAYRMVLSCLHSSSKGYLDDKRYNILRLVREEFGLTKEMCSPFHCEFFQLGLP